MKRGFTELFLQRIVMHTSFMLHWSLWRLLCVWIVLRVTFAVCCEKL